jgi:hypothetical protein
VLAQPLGRGRALVNCAPHGGQRPARTERGQRRQRTLAKSEVNASEISNRCIVHRPASHNLPTRSTHHQRASGASQDSAQRSLRTEPNARGPAMPLRTHHSFPLQGVAIAAGSSPLEQLSSMPNIIHSKTKLILGVFLIGNIIRRPHVGQLGEGA